MTGVEGVSVLPVLDGAGPVREAAYTSRYPLVGDRFTPTTITTEEWSYQYWPGSPEDERLYRLDDDAGQQRDVRGEHPGIARELRDAYLGWMREHNPQMAAWMERAERDPGFRIPAQAFPRIG